MSLKGQGPTEFQIHESWKGGDLLEYFDGGGLVFNRFLLENFIVPGGMAERFPTDYRSMREVLEELGDNWMEDQNELEREDVLSEEIWEMSLENDPIKLGIVSSESFQNLREKSQHGPVGRFVNGFESSRFEHSLDVYFLLKFLESISEVDGGPAAEIKALSHDIGHGAGSHWSEQATGKSWDYHETRAREVLKKERIWGEIEEEYGDIFTQSHPLIDAEKPDLSADRLAYILKDAAKLLTVDPAVPGSIDRLSENSPETSYEFGDIKKVLENTKIREVDGEQRIVMEEGEAAKTVSEMYMDLESQVYFNPEYDLFNEALADAVKIALNEQVLGPEDVFHYTDYEVFELVGRSEKARTHIENAYRSIVEEGSFEKAEDGDVTVKLRRDYVDPHISTDDGLQRVSETNSELKESIEEHRERDGEEIQYRFTDWQYPEVELEDDLRKGIQQLETEPEFLKQLLQRKWETDSNYFFNRDQNTKRTV